MLYCNITHMFSEFSNGYYFSPYWIVEDNNSGKINLTEYEKIKQKIYNTDIPILMKIGKTHFEVKGDENVPTNTIQLSSDILLETNTNRIPEQYPILLAKPKFAKQLLNLKRKPIKSGIEYITQND